MFQPTWTNGSGSEICLPCDVGKFCDREGLVVPTGLCSFGYYCPLRSTSPTQMLCPFGHYCPGAGTVPIKCPDGTASRAGSTSLPDCKPGRYLHYQLTVYSTSIEIKIRPHLNEKSTFYSEIEIIILLRTSNKFFIV